MAIPLCSSKNGELLPSLNREDLLQHPEVAIEIGRLSAGIRSFTLLCIPEGDESLLLIPFNLMVIMLLLSVRTARVRESWKKEYYLGKDKLLLFPYVTLVIRKKTNGRLFSNWQLFPNLQ